MARQPKDATSDAFLQEFLAWVVGTYGELPETPVPAESPPPVPAGKGLVGTAVRLRPEHLAGLRTASVRRGISPTAVLHEILDEWLAAEWARAQ